MAVFDTDMTHMTDVWLGPSSANDDIRLMLIANDIKTYDRFEPLDKEVIYSLERIKTGSYSGATTTLRTHHSKQLNNTREYVSFLETSSESTIAIDPTKWVKGDFVKWKNKGKPAGPNATPPIGAGAAVPTAVTTTAADKLQKEDDNRLQSWRCDNKDAKDYSMLENDEYFAEWRIKMVGQIILDCWEQLIDPSSVLM